MALLVEAASGSNEAVLEALGRVDARPLVTEGRRLVLEAVDQLERRHAPELAAKLRARLSPASAPERSGGTA